MQLMQIDNQLLIDTALFIAGYLAALGIIELQYRKETKEGRTCKR
jgi:hypothetical protein